MIHNDHCMTIPFVSRIDSNEAKKWLQALNHVLPKNRIVSINDLTDDERRQVEIAIVADPDPRDLAGLPRLKWVQSLWAGVEQLLAEMSDLTVKIVRLQDPQMASTMAEAVLTWTLYLHRDMPLYLQQQRQKVWWQHDLVLPSDRTIGILGLGNLGKVSAEKLVQHGFVVYGWSRTNKQIADVKMYTGEAGLKKMLSKTDILVVLLPHTTETENLLNDTTLTYLPQGASIINFARGCIIDERALQKLLDSQQLKHAVLDVFRNEPLPQTDSLWTHPHVTVLPHISAPTNVETACEIVAKNISHYYSSGTIPAFIDFKRGY